MIKSNLPFHTANKQHNTALDWIFLPLLLWNGGFLLVDTTIVHCPQVTEDTLLVHRSLYSHLVTPSFIVMNISNRFLVFFHKVSSTPPSTNTTKYLLYQKQNISTKYNFIKYIWKYFFFGKFLINEGQMIRIKLFSFIIWSCI